MEKKSQAGSGYVGHHVFRKILLMTKLTCICLLIFTLQSSAGGFFAQEKVSLEAGSKNLKTVLQSIEKQSGIHFIYTDNLVTRVNINNAVVKDQPWLDVLQPILKKAGLSLRRLEANQYLITPVANLAYLFVGMVTDMSGNPISDVNVTIKGESRGTKTDARGIFKMTLEKESTVLVFSSVEYELQEIEINAESLNLKRKQAAGVVPTNEVDMVIRMRRTEKMMDSLLVVVNTGYQALPKERSTGSFSVVNGDKIAQKSGSMNVIDRLEGLAPGLSFNYGQGNDKILMRGASSVNLDRQPLIILDGVPVAEYSNIESLVNPQDIKDVTLLKDATAASIWGAQAANGVIVITTKSGQYNNNKIAVSYSGFVSLKGMPELSSLNSMSSADFIKANRELFNTKDYGSAFPYNTVNVGFFPKIYPHEKIYYDLNAGTISSDVAASRWDSLAGLSNRSQIEQYFYQPALLTSHSVSLNGGGKSNRFFSSLSYNRYNNTDRSIQDHYLVNLKEELKIAKWLNFDIAGNMSYSKTKVQNVTLPTGVGLQNYTPYAMFADASGKPLSQSYMNMTPDYQQTAEKNSLINLNYSPLDELNKNRNNSTNLIARVNAGLRFNLGAGLSFVSRGQYQKSNTEGYSFYDQTAYPVRLENVQFTQASGSSAPPTYNLPTTGGRYYTNRSSVTSWTVRNQFEYNNRLGADHQLVALAGVEMRSNLFTTMNTITRGYDFQTQQAGSYNQKALETTGVSNPVLPLNANSSKNTLDSKPMMQAESELRFLSYYGNLAYTFKDRYNLNGSLRYDQSNLFGKASSSQNTPIWSTGLSWNMQKEAFFNSNLFKKLVPRITYGIAGNSPKPGLGGPYDVLYAIATPMFDGLGPGYMVISPANNQLSWEQTKVFNMGVDFALGASGRVSGSIDYYNKQTSDLLGDSPVDPTTGWYSYYGNIGNLYNKGVELLLTSNNISTGSFSWTTNFNLAYNKNKITKLKRYTPLIPSSMVRGGFVEGYPAFSLFAYNYQGLDADGNPLALKADGTTAQLTNQLTNSDVVYMGSTQPLWSGGMTNTFGYKRFSLSGLIIYNFGNVMRNDVNQVYYGRLQTNISNTFDQRWKVPGDEAHTNVPKYIPNQTTSLSQRSTELYTMGNTNVVSASYIKLRDLTLNYTVPLFENSIKALKVYAQMNNLLIWTKNKDHIDPEFYNLSTGSRVAKMPPFYTLGVNVDF